MLQWTVAETEQHKEVCVRFLCRHAEDLGVPYKWSTVMASVYMSLCDNGFLIGLDGSGEVRGLLVYTYGTGEDRYADRSRLEVHLLYLEPDLRGGRSMLQAMGALVERELELYEPIGEICFYGTPNDGNQKLFGRFADLHHSRKHRCGPLDFYVTTPGRLGEYVARYDAGRRPLHAKDRLGSRP